MSVIFGAKDYSFFDRKYNHEVGGKTSNLITMGACSYVGSAVFEFNENYPANILVGRFSSMAWQLTFLIGYNHRRKNVVTTFPFEDDPDFLKALSVHWGGGK